MAWTSPRTWTVGEKLTAALLNTHLRDQLLYLKGVIDGSGSDKITPTALNLTSTASLQMYNSSLLSSASGSIVEISRALGNDGANTNTLRTLLVRAAAGVGWATTAWRLAFDVDAGLVVPAYLELGNGYSLLVIGTKIYKFDSAGLTTLPGAVTVGGLVKLPATTGSKLDLYGDGLNNYQIGVASARLWQKGQGNISFYDSADTPGASATRLNLDTSTGQLTGKAFYDSGEFTVTAGAYVSLVPGWNAPARSVIGIYNTASGVERYPMVVAPQMVAGQNGARIALLPYDSVRNDIVVYNDSSVTLYCRVWAMR